MIVESFGVGEDGERIQVRKQVFMAHPAEPADIEALIGPFAASWQEVMGMKKPHMRVRCVGAGGRVFWARPEEVGKTVLARIGGAV